MSPADPADEPVGVERTVATRTDKIAVSGRIDLLDARLAESTRPAESTVLAESTVVAESTVLAGSTVLAESTGPAEGAGTELVVVTTRPDGTCSPWTSARSSLALALYALAAGRVLRRPCHRVELHHLPSGEVLAWSHTDQLRPGT